MNIIFNIQGGLGKNIMATAVCSAIKKKYPKSFLIVVSGYKDVFLNNPNVDKVINHQDQVGIYKKFIHKMDVKFMTIDPYHTSAYLNRADHLIKIWCDLFELPYDGEMPEFFLTKAEKQFYKSVYKSDKPILAIQPNGGGANQGTVYNWARDIPQPTMEKLIEKLKKRYTIVHIKRPDQPVFQDTLQALDGYRSIAYLISVAEKCLFIDSFAQHLAVAMNKKAVVCWITTDPKVFGYDFHDNVQSSEFSRQPIYDHPNYTPFNLVEMMHTIPYSDLNEIFNVNSLYNKLKL